MTTSNPNLTRTEAQIETELRSRINVARAVLFTRVQHGLTQAQLAGAAGTKQSRISEIESLDGNVRFDTLDRVARALGLEITLTARAAASTNVTAVATHLFISESLTVTATASGGANHSWERDTAARAAAVVQGDYA